MIVSIGGGRETYCESTSRIEEPMVPFGSNCEDQGEGLVFNQKATRFFLFLFLKMIETCFNLFSNQIKHQE